MLNERGREVTGVTETVLSRSRVIIDGGKFVGKAGAGVRQPEFAEMMTER